MTRRTKADLRTLIDTRITNETQPDTVSPADVGGLLKDLVDSLAPVELTFSDLGGQIADGQIPALIMRDMEFTAAAVRNLLGLTEAEVNNLFTGATISGQTLTFTQNDGSVINIAIPTAAAGTGDGVVQSGAIIGTDLVLTLDNGGQITIDIDTLATDTELASRPTLSDVLSAIREGTNISIDRSVAGRITISASGSGGGATIHFNDGTLPVTLGADGDYGVNTQTGDWYRKVGGAWVIRYNAPTVLTASEVMAFITAALASHSGDDDAHHAPPDPDEYRRRAIAAVMSGAGITINRNVSGQITIRIANNADLPGSPTAPTPPAADNSRRLATTAWVTLKAFAQRAGAVFTGPVSGITPTEDEHFATKAYVDSVAGGVTPPPPTFPTLRFGTSDDDVPTAAEATVTGVNGRGTIAAYAGRKHLLIYRPVSEGDITSVRFSTDTTNQNQISVFEKYASPVQVAGVAQSVWVTEELIDNPDGVTMTVGG